VTVQACGNNISVPASRPSSPRIIFLDCLILKTGRAHALVVKVQYINFDYLFTCLSKRLEIILKLGNITARVYAVSTNCKDRVEKALN